MSKRGEKLGKELGAFLKQYARKAYKNIDPNDRRYDHTIERLVKRLKPEELDRLMREDLEDKQNS
jgi:pheromone shutdown protein TraB